MRGRALLATAAVLLVGATLLVGAQSTDARPDAEGAPWWGPGSADSPEEGWHFRIPVAVHNPHDHAIPAPTAKVELDLGQRLVDAGWNAQTVGARTFPTTFTLDHDSFRVLRYQPGFINPTSGDPLPSQFHRSLFEGDQGTNYDPSRNPAGTLVFEPQEAMEPDETRFYLVYFAAEQHGGQPSQDEGLPGWPQQGWGTTAYGFTNVAQGRPDGIDLVAREPGTTATVYTFDGVNPQPADLPDHDNPLELATDELERIRLPPRTFFKVEADKPVLVGSRGKIDDGEPPTYGGGAFVPSTSGDAVGRSFLVPGYTPKAFVVTAETGEATVTVENAAGETQQQLSLSAARPFASIDLPVSQTQAKHVRLDVTDGVPVLVQLAGRKTGSHTSIARDGGPLGTEHFLAAPSGSTLNLRSPSNASIRVLDAGDPGRQLFPFGRVDETDPAELEPWPPARPAPPGGANSSWPRERPAHLVSLPENDRPAQPVFVSSGPGDPHGHFPLDQRLTTYVQGPVAVFGLHNATTVEVTEPLDDGTVDRRTRTVHEDGIYAFEPSEDNTDGGARLSLSKPASVVPTGTAETYADILPAHGPDLAEDVGALGFRGALVRLDTVDGAGDRSVTTVGPGQTATFDVSIANVGDFQGRSITEEVELDCEDPPTGWRVSGCKDTLTLSTDQSVTTTVEVEAAEANPGERFVTTVTARGSTWNVTDQVQVGAVVRESFGVETWFFEKGGPKQRLDDPFLVEEGGRRSVPVVVKNTGTVEDTYRLDLADPQQGWTLDVHRHGESADSLTLGPGETATLTLAIEVAQDPSLIETGVELEVVSTSNQLAFDKLRGRAQIASELNLTLASPTPVQLADPGEPTEFPLEIANNGDGVVTVDLNVSSGLPETWSVDIETDSVTLFPGNKTQLALDVHVPAGEKADERGTVRITGETERGGSSDPVAVLTTIVRHRHELTGPSQPIPLEPGSGAELNLPLVNTGNGAERIRLLGTSPAWSFSTPNVTEIPANETGTLPIRLDAPSDLPPGQRNLTLHLSLSRETQTNLTVPLDVQPTPRLRVDLPDPPPLLPGREVTINTTVASQGNVPVAGNLTTTLPEAWNVSFQPQRLNLDPGERTPLLVHITGPPNPPEEALTLRFRTEGGPHEAEGERHLFPVGRPDLSLAEASVSERGDGGVLATVQLTNNGNVDARDAKIALVRGDEVLAQTTVARLAPGDTISVAVGDADVNQASGLALVADPEDAMPDPNREDNRIELSGQDLPVSTAAFVLAPLAAALLARRWRA